MHAQLTAFGIINRQVVRIEWIAWKIGKAGIGRSQEFHRCLGYKNKTIIVAISS
jgi:hypothetical protein